MRTNRRRFLALGTAAAAAGLAGCGSDASTPTPGGGQGRDTPTDEPTATPTGPPPGADQAGGPDDLQSSVAVEATVLESDAGAGRYVNTPAVAWVEQGATVTWELVGGSHSVTAYHPDNDRVRRIPLGAQSFDSGLLSAGETFEHTFETPGVYDYFCRPHEGLGMVGLVVVGDGSAGGGGGGGGDGGSGTGDGSGAAYDGPGAAPVEEVRNSSAADALSQLLTVAGLAGDGEQQAAYGWQDATWDSYWYSLYNMSTTISLSGNGVRFPHNEQQQAAFDERFPKMLQAAGREKPPVKNATLNVAAFTEGDPQFTHQPVLSGPDGRPDASTLQWDTSNSSGVVSPSSLAWTHLKGVTWAKNFERHFDVLPDDVAPRFRSQVLATLAQLGVRATLVAGGPDGNGALTKGERLELVSGFRPATGEVVDDTARPGHHAAMLWFLSDLVSLARGGWFGYENPQPLIPAENLQTLADGLARTTTNAFPPADVVSAGSTRTLGTMLGAMGWYGTHAGSDQLASMAADYATRLADEVETHHAGNGRIDDGAANLAATQGAVGQGLLWASRIDGVDRTDLAGEVLGYLLDVLFDPDAGTFASGPGDDTYRITARDAGDVTGGVNAAEAVLGRADARAIYARYFDATVNRGRLQRAERPPSRDESAEHTLPLPPAAGGEFGQAAVYNAAVEYDTGSDEWSVVDDRFLTAPSLYLANQEIWISQWGGDFFAGRGVPGEERRAGGGRRMTARSDAPEEGGG